MATSSSENDTIRLHTNKGKKRSASGWVAVGFLPLAIVVVSSITGWQNPWLQDSDLPWVLGLGGLLALAILWKVPQWQIGFVEGLEPKERFDRVNEARKTLAQILGGIVLLAGFFGTWQNIKVAQQSLAVAREGQITDRFNKAVEQLVAGNAGEKEKGNDKGADKLEVRIAGIYTLGAIANESPALHWPVMEMLDADLRKYLTRSDEELAKEDKGWDGVDNVPLGTHSQLGADCRAILTVLQKRDPRFEGRGQALDLSKLNLRAANLAGAYLGGADLRRSDLSGADLRGADLRGAYLSRASLREAKMNGANLSGAHLDGADLFNADLESAILANAILTVATVKVGDSTITIPAKLSESNLKDTNLDAADLTGADLRNARNLTPDQLKFAKK